MAAGIRLVVSDVDGTLLDPAGVVSRGTLEALGGLRHAGVMFALATSRRWTGTVPLAQQLGLAAPLILYDGALIREYPSGEMLGADALDPASAQLAAEALAAHGLQPIAQYCDSRGEYLRVAESATHPEWTEEYLERFASQTRRVRLDLLSDQDVGPLRLVAFGPISVLRRAAVALAHLHVGRQLLLAGSYGLAELTIFSRSASKGAALARIVEYYGMSLEETLAVGDGLNDISMLRAAGLGVAMGHAPRRVRAAAHAVTASNEEDGLALAIGRYVLATAGAG
jgi:Cof subfamily protein (haloacid dehalogenase superfamily)